MHATLTANLIPFVLFTNYTTSLKIKLQFCIKVKLGLNSIKWDNVFSIEIKPLHLSAITGRNM
jgi:hypothetical protein